MVLAHRTVVDLKKKKKRTREILYPDNYNFYVTVIFNCCISSSAKMTLGHGPNHVTYQILSNVLTLL